MSATVKLARGVRLVCAACGQTVASAGRRVEPENQLGDFLAGRHQVAGAGSWCAGSLQPAPVSEVVTPPAAPVVRSGPPGAGEAEQQVGRWNRDCPAGTHVVTRLEPEGPEHGATTVSIAWIAEGWPVVAIAERDAPVRLDALRPLGAEESLPPLPPLHRAPRRRASGTREGRSPRAERP
jgi:hypothetical protein